jgi:hypothetical protein
MPDKTIQDTNDLLNYLVEQAKEHKHWFGFIQQRMTGINLVHQIASRHADKMTPVEVVEYVRQLNNEIFNRMIKPGA